MRLYLDLTKAVTPPNVGTDTKPEKQTVSAQNSSYGKQPVGATGGDASPDKPEVGKRWHSGKSDTVEEEGEDKKVEKAFTSDACDLLKSLNQKIAFENSKLKPTTVEVEFLTTVGGYTQDDVKKGRAYISGKNRHVFNEWMNDRLEKSISQLLKDVG